MAQHSERSGVEKLRDLIQGIRVAMLTTFDEDGALHSRPMATQEAEFDGILWFFTAAGSPKVGELQRDQRVNLSYAQPDENRFVSISGTARLVRDREKIQELWSPILKAWFPEGLDDPQLALLEVQVAKAEYWDAPSSKMVQLVGLLKAAVSGKTYAPGEHEKLEPVGRH